MAKEVKVKTSKTSKTLCFNINVDIMWTNCCFGLMSKSFAHYFWFLSAVNLKKVLNSSNRNTSLIVFIREDKQSINHLASILYSSLEKTNSLSFGLYFVFFVREDKQSINHLVSILYSSLEKTNSLSFGLYFVFFVREDKQSIIWSLFCILR
jgi:hypothetical protein